MPRDCPKWTHNHPGHSFFAPHLPGDMSLTKSEDEPMTLRNHRDIPTDRLWDDARNRHKRPQGRYAQMLEMIGFGRAPQSPQAAALARM